MPVIFMSWSKNSLNLCHWNGKFEQCTAEMTFTILVVIHITIKQARAKFINTQQTDYHKRNIRQKVVVFLLFMIPWLLHTQQLFHKILYEAITNNNWFFFVKYTFRMITDFWFQVNNPWVSNNYYSNVELQRNCKYWKLYT